MNPDRTRPASAGELVSLGERMGQLQTLRVGMAAVALGSALVAPSVIGRAVQELLPASALYLLLAGCVESLRRLGRTRRLSLIGSMLLADGIYLAWLMYLTGGVQSPLRFLVYLHIVAVSLLVSYRTGLKVTVWHTLLFFVVFYAQASGHLDVTERIPGALPGNGSGFYRLAAFNVGAMWLIATATVAFSRLNERDLRRRKDDLEVLAEMATEFEQAAQAENIAATLLDKAAKAFGFRRGLVIAGAEREEMNVLAYIGPGEQPIATAGVDPVIDELWASHRPDLLKSFDVERDRRLSSMLPLAHNLVLIPMFADGIAIGAFVLENPNEGKVERRVVAMLSQFASHAALAIRNAWLLGQVKKLAETDALTGLSNRRTFEHRLTSEMSRAQRNGEQVTLMMVDVDHFKNFNDTYGHQAGDDVLKAVAEALHEASRDFDIPARYGGEEFAVVLPSCSSKESLVVAERIRKAISAIESHAPVTASAGVATFPVHASDPEALIKAADEALYESKRAGRNRVTRSRRKAGSRTIAGARAGT